MVRCERQAWPKWRYVIFGHVSGPEVVGAFYNLKKLRPGDEVTITRGDNTAYTYVVRRSQTYEANEVDMNAVLAPVNATVPGLNIMTCDGTYDAKSQTFSKRLVVFMSLASKPPPT